MRGPVCSQLSDKNNKLSRKKAGWPQTGHKPATNRPQQHEPKENTWLQTQKDCNAECLLVVNLTKYCDFNHLKTNEMSTNNQSGCFVSAYPLVNETIIVPGKPIVKTNQYL